jgi:predicted ATPase
LATVLQQLGSAGSMAEYPAFLAALANGRALTGQIDEARTAIDQAISRSEISGECWCAAELLRIRGEIRLLQDAPDATSAEDCLRQSLDVARLHGALSWELRAATSFVRLPRDGRRRPEARELLAQIFERYTEGFETADLVSARLLLGEATATASASPRAAPGKVVLPGDPGQTIFDPPPRAE